MTKLRVGDHVAIQPKLDAPLPAPAGPQTPDAAATAIEKAHKTAAQWTKNVAKLRAEIAKREASGRGETRALKQARERLMVAERRNVEAVERLERLKVNPFAGHTAGERAPGRDRKAIEKDAREEAKRIAKRRKQLERRTTKDRRADTTRERFGIRRQRAAQPIAAEEATTWPTGPIVPYVPPKVEGKIERAGLLPGDFRLIDRVDDFDLYRPPKEWTPQHVGDRMVEAHKVLRRLPMKTRPQEFGANWPEYVHVGVELAYQAGAGTLRVTRAIKGTSADEVARCTAAIGWPLTYLIDKPYLARALNQWAFEAGIGEAGGMDNAAFEAASIIADMLNKGKVKVT